METRYGFDPWNLKGLIAESGLTVAEVAKELGISKSSLTRCLNGQSEPSLKNAVLLADYFKVSVGCIIGREKLSFADGKLVEMVGFYKGMQLLGLVGSMKSHREKMELEMVKMMERMDEICELVGDSVSTEN